jgi:ferric-dicitrate binding protein FerR (iron transport regulator)
MTDHAEPDWTRLADYLAGDTPPDVTADVECWIAETPERDVLVRRLREVWARREETSPFRFDAATTETNVMSRVAPSDAVLARERFVSRNAGRALSLRRHIARLVFGGAVAAGLLVVSIVAGRRTPTTRTATPSAYATGHAQIARITLPDSTTVVLAPNSALTVAAGFRERRDVHLRGHAVFTVTHASGAPFTVHSGNVATRVLGTTFGVRHYVTDATVHVAVVTGKVQVSSATARAITLVAGMSALMCDSTTQTTTGDAESSIGWINGVLAFDRKPARDVLDAVGHWYGYEFKLADSTLALQPLSVRFDGDPAGVVLRSLSAILNASFTYNGRVVTVTPRRTGQTVPTRTRRDSLTHTSMEIGR